MTRAASGTRWSYANFTVATIQGNEKLLAKLNELGAEGWELVGFHPILDKRGEPAITGLLKRPYTDDEDRPQQPSVDAIRQ